MRRFAVVLGLVCALLGGCEKPSSIPRHGAFGPSAIIVVPGYYGTKLTQVSDGDLVWVDAWEALFGRRSLRLPLPGLGFDGALDLQPDGILQQITVIPWLYSVEGYGSLINALRERVAGAQVVPLAYDWRLDLMEAVRQLGGVVDDLRQQGHSRIAIVAHSMGGLVAGYYLRYGTQDPSTAVETWTGAANVSAAILAGVPYRGSMTQFRNMQYGVTIGLNRTLLEPKAVASFPAGYYLLPAGSEDVLLTPAYEPRVGMIRDARNWGMHEWGLLKEPESLAPAFVDRRLAYTAQWLRRAGRFSDLLLAAPGVTNPTPVPLLSLFGSGHPTIVTGVLLHNEEGSRLLFDQKHFREYLPAADPERVFEDGDGSVTVESSSLPAAYRAAFRVTAREYRVGHEDLAADLDVLDDMVKFLTRPTD